MGVVPFRVNIAFAAITDGSHPIPEHWLFSPLRSRKQALWYRKQIIAAQWMSTRRPCAHPAARLDAAENIGVCTLIQSQNRPCALSLERHAFKF
jgi:hypothetical protein